MDALKQQVLAEMGIVRWTLREPITEPDSSEAQTEAMVVEAVPVSSPVVEEPAAVQPAVSQPVDRVSLDQQQAVVSNCERCNLTATRKNTVFGTGNPDADWMFIGEAPGAEEDRQGLPFVGRAGQLLNSMLFALGMQRDQVYIANVLKCRPPDNRDPLGEEVIQCSPYLMQQIDAINPRMIISMGRFAAQALLKTHTPIGKLRGRVHHFGETGIPMVATYHPAYLLRSPLEKRKAWQDLVLAKATYDARLVG